MKRFITILSLGVGIFFLSFPLFGAEQKNPELSFSISPQEVTLGEHTTINWDISSFARQGVACVALGPGHWNGPLSRVKGEKAIIPLETFAYRLNCGDVSVERVVRVKKPEISIRRAVDFFVEKVPDNSVFKGEPITLRWKIAPPLPIVQKCTVSSLFLLQPLMEGEEHDGRVRVTPQRDGQTYYLECGGLAKAEIRIMFAPPSIEFFRISQVNPDGSFDQITEGDEVKPGTSLIAEWQVHGADACEGSSKEDKEWNKKNLSMPAGTHKLAPLTSRIYEILCSLKTGDGEKKISKRIEIIVKENAPTLSFSVLPVRSLEGYRLNILKKAGYKTGMLPYEAKWSSENVVSCQASSSDGSWKGRRGTKGQELVLPSLRTTYTMECTNVGGKKVRQGPKFPGKKEALSFIFSNQPEKETIEIKAGDFVNLKWSAKEIERCMASSQPKTRWSGVKGYDGEETIFVSEQTHFGLQCGHVEKSLTVVIAKEDIKILPIPKVGMLSAIREPDVLATTPFVAGKSLPPLTFRLKAEKEAIAFSSFEISSDTQGMLAALRGAQLTHISASSTPSSVKSTGSGPNALLVYGFGDIEIPAGGSVVLQLALTVPPVLAPSVEFALKKAGSDTIRLANISAVGSTSKTKIAISQPLALLTIVPPEQIIEKPQDTPQKISVSSIPYTDSASTSGNTQIFSGMNVHNFTDKPIKIGSVLVKFTEPVVDRVQLQYSNAAGGYDAKASAVSGQGRENHFYFTFEKPLIIEPDPRIPHKIGDAGLMKWWFVGVTKKVDKKINFEVILEDIISPENKKIEIEPYTEPIFNFEVNNFTVSLDNDPISHTILTVAPEQPLLLKWHSQGMDMQKGCTALLARGGNDRDKKNWTGKKTVDGETWVYPTVTSLYALSCVSGSNTVTRNVFVQINEISKSIPFIDFTYRKGKNEKKQEGAYLTWQIKNASSCEASNGSQQKQTSWKGKKIFSKDGKDRFTEFVARPAGETLNSFFLQCEPHNNSLKGYFSSSFSILWGDGQDEDELTASLDPLIPQDLPVGSVPGDQLLGGFTIEFPKNTDMLERIVLARDQKFGDRTLGDVFKGIWIQYEDAGSGNVWIITRSVSGDAAISFGKPPSIIKNVQGPVHMKVYGQLRPEDALKKAKISEKGERMRLIVTDADALKKEKKILLSTPFSLQTFLVKVSLPPPPPPPVVQKGILFASRVGADSVEVKEGQARLTLGTLSFEALGEDIEIRSITINQSLGTELSSVLSHPQLVIKNEKVLFAVGDMRGDTIYFEPMVFTQKLVLPKTGKPVELLLIADVAASISESFKEKIRSNPVVLSVNANGVSAIGLASNQLIGNSTPFDLVTLTFPPKTVDNTACDATVETFKATGKIRCGRIQWDITPKSAQVFNGDPREYLMKYDEFYGFLKDFMGGYEPKQGKLILRENPNNEYPADANWWDSVIRMDTAFTVNHVVSLGNFPVKTFSPSLMHEMGHIFGLGPEIRPAYMWKDLTEGHANMVGILPYMMAYDGKFKLISDFWCTNKLRKNYPCPDYFTNFEDYPEWLGANKDLEKYVKNGETFSTLFIDPPKDQGLHQRGGKFMTMLTTLYSEFKKQGKGSQFYEGYKNAQQFYIKNPTVFPLTWIHGDPDFDIAPDIILRANTYLLLLSSYVKADLLTPFEARWRTPILGKTKEAFVAVEKGNFSENSIRASLKVFFDSTSSAHTVSGHGLKGAYYMHQDLGGLPTLTRIDPRIDFVWGGTPPAEKFSNDLFSVRWTGFIVAPQTATYTFSTIADDGARLWVDNTRLIDDWNVHAPTLKSGSITLEKGRAYPIKLEYFEKSMGSGIRLAWAVSGGYMEIIPTSALFFQDPLKK
ncbi:hypothetical protein HY621_03125 [Candidatus Uhrbacteria bacterium]|nr:hypothetical protein [Candidatus Uhrbacteria bacterium]